MVKVAAYLIAPMAEPLLEFRARFKTRPQLRQLGRIGRLADGMEQQFDFDGPRFQQIFELDREHHKLVVFFPYRARFTD